MDNVERATPDDCSKDADRKMRGVPLPIADAFFWGIDDVTNGRTFPVSFALAEGRRRIAEYRARKEL